MTAGARTPEELDSLLEDGFVLRDPSFVEPLFDDGALLVVAGEVEARGAQAIGRAVAELWAREWTYLARPRHVLQTRDVALVVADAGIHVLSRGGDGAWRATISLLGLETPTTGGPMSQDRQLLQAIATRSGEGEAWWWFGSLAEIKATAEHTGGLLSIIEITEAPNAAGPLHVHHREDESFWILEGSATIEVGETTIEAGAGDFVFGPRDVPHRYTVGDAGCRMLFIMTPGGFENLIREMSVPAQARTLPPASDEEPDWNRVAAIARAHGAELLG